MQLFERERPPGSPSLWTRFRRFVPFLGPAFLVSVGYMDPGNWATNIAGGSGFGYTLLWVLLLSNLMAIVLQTLTAKLGVATCQTLAAAIRANTPRPVSLGLWLTAEAAAMATDLAEFLGAALGFYILLSIPLLPAALLTGACVFLILGLHRFGYRKVEVVILALVAIVGFAYLYEVIITKPDPAAIVHGTLVPEFASSAAVLVAVGMLGATVMPHNIFLGSHVVQERLKSAKTMEAKRKLYRYSIFDLLLALNVAWLINSAMIIMSAAAFQGKAVESIEAAHATLAPLFGGASAFAFAIALLAAGLSSSVTGTLAGQSIMEGFIGYRMSLFVRRAITMVPAIIAIALGVNTLKILILSQVVLSLQLPFTIIPLILLTRSKRVMGEFANRPWLQGVAWLIASIIVGLNVYLLWTTFS